MVREAGLFIAPTLSLERRGRAVSIGLPIRRWMRTGQTLMALKLAARRLSALSVVSPRARQEFQEETDVNETQGNVVRVDAGRQRELNAARRIVPVLTIRTMSQLRLDGTADYFHANDSALF